ncbi:MAG TPA: hypothetical protein VFA22_01895, partial [Stellaceae bacterium]|nr:hypothetical protein [Stellaceae bacterium]
MLCKRWFGLLVLACSAAWAPCARADTPYTVDFKGIGEAPVEDALRNASQLVALQDRPPPSPAALRRRADDDLPRLQDVMHAQGYWASKIAYRLDTNQSPATVTVTVTPGPAFRFRDIRFVLPSGAPAPLLARDGAASVGLPPGGVALSAAVEAANAQIVALYERDGYPFAKIADRRA